MALLRRSTLELLRGLSAAREGRRTSLLPESTARVVTRSLCRTGLESTARVSARSLCWRVLSGLLKLPSALLERPARIGATLLCRRGLLEFPRDRSGRGACRNRELVDRVVPQRRGTGLILPRRSRAMTFPVSSESSTPSSTASHPPEDSSTSAEMNQAIELDGAAKRELPSPRGGSSAPRRFALDSSRESIPLTRHALLPSSSLRSALLAGLSLLPRWNTSSRRSLNFASLAFSTAPALGTAPLTRWSCWHSAFDSRSQGAPKEKNAADWSLEAAREIHPMNFTRSGGGATYLQRQRLRQASTCAQTELSSHTQASAAGASATLQLEALLAVPHLWNKWPPAWNLANDRFFAAETELGIPRTLR